MLLVVLRPDAAAVDVDRVCDLVRERGLTPQVMAGATQTAVAIDGVEGRAVSAALRGLSGVADVLQVDPPYPKAARAAHPQRSVVTIAPGVAFGGAAIPVIAGPCSVETEAQIVAAATMVKAAGAVALRGGAFKPRSSPYAFQGLGPEGLRLLARAREATGLAIVTEAMDDEGARQVAEVADCIQVGARNMQNFALLKTVGRLGRPVLLKRGAAATIADLLLAAEYVLHEGNPNVILCERGLRSFDATVRNLFDLTAIPVVQQVSHLPIIADPSHGTGRRDLVLPMARAALAAGADGLLIEVHPEPERALSDGAQSQSPTQFAETMRQLAGIAAVLGRSLA